MELHILAASRPSPAYHVVQAGIPTEPQALFVYVLVAIALVWVWLGSRGSGGAIESGPPEQDTQDTDVSSRPVSRSRRKRKKKRPITWVQ
jgi:hypothetical protein